MRKKKSPLASLTPEQYEARLNKILLAKLGQAWMWWPPRAEAKRLAVDPNKPGWFICATCHQSHEVIEVDHIIPCVKLEGDTTWDEYIKRRFVFSAKKLQCLCRSCHKAKSREENKVRSR